MSPFVSGYGNDWLWHEVTGLIPVTLFVFVVMGSFSVLESARHVRKDKSVKAYDLLKRRALFAPYKTAGVQGWEGVLGEGTCDHGLHRQARVRIIFC